MSRAALFALAALFLAGCRREDWQTCSVPLPDGADPAAAVAAVRALDRQTPPQAVLREGRLDIRYNSLHVAPANFVFALDRLAPRKE